MTRNFIPDFIRSKTCYGVNCGKVIFWNENRHYYTDGPNADSPKHSCEGTRPSESRRQSIFDRISKNEVMLQEILLKTTEIISSNEERHGDIRKRIWELSQKVDDIKKEMTK
jgi:hypothetical protein